MVRHNCVDKTCIGVERSSLVLMIHLDIRSVEMLSCFIIIIVTITVLLIRDPETGATVVDCVG